eukprot:6204029-Pleurochrysis_carterae.AAC.3
MACHTTTLHVRDGGLTPGNGRAGGAHAVQRSADVKKVSVIASDSPPSFAHDGIALSIDVPVVTFQAAFQPVATFGTSP